VVTSLALSFADDYLESGRGMFCGASEWIMSISLAMASFSVE